MAKGGEEDTEGRKVSEASKGSKAHKEGTDQGRLVQVSQWLVGAQPWVQTHVSRSLPQAS